MDSETIEYIFAANTSNLEAGARKANAALTSLLAPLKKVNSELAATEKGMERSGRAASNAGSQMQGAGRAGFNMWQLFGATGAADLTVRLLSSVKDAVVSLGQSLFQLGQTAIQRAMSFDALKQGLAVFAGGAEKANKQIERLRILAKAPGLGFREAVEGSLRLQSIKLSAEQAENAMLGFSRAVAIGGGNKENLQNVLYQLQQLATSTKVLGNDLRPIITQAPVVAAAIEKMFGSTKAEDVAARLEKAGIGTKQFLELLTAELLKLPQPAETAANAMDNFTDTLDAAFVAAGTPLLEPLKLALQQLSPQLEATGKAVGAAMANMAASIKDIWASVPDATKSALDKMLADITASLGLQAAQFKKTYPELKATVVSTLGDIAKEWEQHGGKVTQTVTAMMETIRRSFKVGMAAMRGDWEQFWAELPGLMWKGFYKTALLLLRNMWVFLINNSIPGIIYHWSKAGLVLANALIDGLYAGLVRGYAKVEGYVTQMANTIKNAFSGALQIQSPSKVFYKYGVNITEGLTNGIKDSAHFAVDAIKALALDVQMTAALALGAKTIRDRLANVLGFDEFGQARSKDRPRRAGDGSLTPGDLDNSGTRPRRFEDGFLTPQDLAGGDRLPGRPRFFAPPPIEPWVNFMDTLKLKFQQFRESIPSIKKALGETFVDLPQRIGDVFANAVSNWDGTFKGFFKSLAQGFADLMRQIAAELIKLMVVKAITSALSGILGGLGGSTQFTGTTGAIKGFASGGMARGWSVVGEKGPELVNFGGGARVYSNEDSAAMMGGKTPNIIINVSAPDGSTTPKSRRQIADAAVQGLNAWQRAHA